MGARIVSRSRHAALSHCAQFGAFVALIAAGAAAWLGIVVICSRIF